MAESPFRRGGCSVAAVAGRAGGFLLFGMGAGGGGFPVSSRGGAGGVGSPGRPGGRRFLASLLGGGEQTIAGPGCRARLSFPAGAYSDSPSFSGENVR